MYLVCVINFPSYHSPKGKKRGTTHHTNNVETCGIYFGRQYKYFVIF